MLIWSFNKVKQQKSEFSPGYKQGKGSPNFLELIFQMQVSVGNVKSILVNRPSSDPFNKTCLDPQWYLHQINNI